MQTSQASESHQGRDIILFSIGFLFFFQLISDFIEAVYVFGLLGTGIPPEIVSVLFLFSPVLLLLFGKKLPGWLLVAAGELMLLCRVLEVMVDTRGKMIVAGLGVAAFLVFMPGLFAGHEHKRGESLGIGLMLGLAASIALRAVNSGVDISTHGGLQAIGWLLAVVAGYLLWRLRKPSAEANAPPKAASTGRVVGLSLGLACALLLLYFAFASPNVIARWTGADYLSVLIAAVMGLCLTAGIWLMKGRATFNLSSRIVLIWNIVFVLALVTTILPYQIGFPDSPAGYPLAEPSVAGFYQIPLYLMLLTFPVILIDFKLFAEALIDGRPTPRALGTGFTVAALFMLVMILAHVFTTVYDYIPVIGPYFRDQFWLVYLILGVGLTLATLLIHKEGHAQEQAVTSEKVKSAVRWALLFLVGIALVGARQTAATPVSPTADASSLRVFTYNVQQGYSEDGLWNFDGQLELIQEMNPDILGLQESDTNRIAGGNTDLVRYFADRLDMYSYYGPTSVTGTFGIALLSKYPIENPHTYFLYSIGEQVAVIEAQISVGGQTFNVYVTHLGNDGPIVQQEGFLEIVAGKEDVIAMGDFNFRPPTEQYTLTTETLDDAYLLSTQVVEAAGFDLADCIDHVFVTPNTQIGEARYLVGPQSDHPAMFVVVEW